MRQVDWFLPAIGISEDVLPVAVDTCTPCSWGMPGPLAFFSLRYTSEGLGRTKPIMFTGFLGLTVNVIGNWIFIYGSSAPELGAVGCGSRHSDIDLAHVLRDVSTRARIAHIGPSTFCAHRSAELAGARRADSHRRAHRRQHSRRRRFVCSGGVDDGRHGCGHRGRASDRAELCGLHVHGAARHQLGNDHSRRSYAGARRSRSVRAMRV